MDKGEKILEVKHRPFSFFDYAISLFLFLFAIFMIYVIHTSTTISSVGYIWGWLLSIGALSVVVWGYLFSDRDAPIIVIYENGLWSKRFPLSCVQFVPWQDISVVKINGLAVIFVPYDIQKYSRRVRLFYKMDAVFFSCPIFLRFGTAYVGFYDVDATHFVNACQSALANYRAKHGA